MSKTIPANNPTLKSWVDVPVGSDFPIQNLPFGIFKTRYLPPVAGIAIGDHVIDLVILHEHGFLDGLDLPPGIFNQRFLNNFLALGRKQCGTVRDRVSELLRTDNETLQSNKPARELALIHHDEIQMLMPLKIHNYTDFYSSEQHAFNVGSLFRDPKNALLPNWKHMPVAYHGRASSIVVSGTPIHRPHGQIKGQGDQPLFGLSQKVDFELEVAFVTCSETDLGSSIPVEKASDHIFGFVLFNDWSARDIQQWEYVPLGPFLGKNFGSVISPWIITADALEPFRVQGPTQDPPVLEYLKSKGDNHYDVKLEVSLQPDNSEPTIISRSNLKFLYWNVNQQLAHHTVNGCNIEPGDLNASGTISGPAPDSFGSMLELTWNGQQSIRMKDGSDRKFIEDGDTITITAFAEKDGVRIGFGECKSKILAGRKNG